MDDRPHQPSRYVSEDVPFAALDLVYGIIAARLADLRVAISK